MGGVLGAGVGTMLLYGGEDGLYALLNLPARVTDRAAARGRLGQDGPHARLEQPAPPLA